MKTQEDRFLIQEHQLKQSKDVRERKAKYMRKYRAANKEKDALYQKEYSIKYRKENKEKIEANRTRWRKDNAEHDKNRVWNNRLMKEYGIDSFTYGLMLEKQSYCCKTCGKHADDNHNKKLYIDHDHKTGKVRGLLCLQCNTALGLLKDNKKVIKNLLKYI